jgi:hypothetical protein
MRMFHRVIEDDGCDIRVALNLLPVRKSTAEAVLREGPTNHEIHPYDVKAVI